MGITKFAVKYPVSVLMLTLGVCLLGIISYNKLGTDLFPDLKNPALYIELEAGERPPEEIEKQFIEQIESTAARQEGVKQVSSCCKAGGAIITVEYDWEQDMDAAFLDLQRSMSQIGQNKEITSLNVSRYDANAAPVMTIAMRHRDITDMNELRKIAENYMRSEFVRLEGVADLQLNGQEEGYVEIKTDSYMLDAFGLTAETIASKIEGLNQNVSGGTIVNDEIQYSIKGVNLLKSLEDISNIIVAFKTSTNTDTPGNTSPQTNVKAPIYLKDVARIELCNKEPENLARYNGERCLCLSIYKENKYNTVQAVENITKKLEELKKSMPGYEFHVISNQGDFIGASIGEVKDSAVMGILLAMIILYIFLRRINTTFIVSISIPVSIIATFNLMYFNGLTINIMTLGGLALGAGMLIDNAIVVMENIYRNLEDGLSPKEAAIKGTSEVAGAITSSTLTTIVVFLPIVYIQGAAGELFKEQAWTVSFSLLSSLFAAILLMPMLASKYVNKTTKSKESVQIKGYGKFVGKLLKYRYTVVTTAFIVATISYMLVPLLKMEFMPKAESREFSTLVTLEPGARLQSTDNAAATIEMMITELAGEDLEWIFTQIGPSNTESQSGSGNLEEENQAEIKVRLKTDSHLDADAIISRINQDYVIPNGIEISFEKEQSALQSILGNDEAPVVIEVKGKELELIEELCNEVKEKLSSIAGIYDIRTSMEKGAPEIDISIDRLKSGIYGIDISSVASQVKNKLNGTTAGTFESEGEPVDIEIRVPEVSLSELENVEIVQEDKKYRLGEIADVSITTAPKEINRKNQSRIGKVTAMLPKGYTLNSVTPAINAQLECIQFPAQYSAKITGEEEKRAESFNGLSFALLLSIILVYMVMASQFESLRHPFTILLTIPLAGVGCIYAFLLIGASLNMMAFIGIIMLAGIAVNNSILLVDATNKLKEEGHTLTEALQAAAQQRIRPIIMTSLTTILALLPMCFGFGEGASLRSPMALAVIGGLFTSTVMTLVVIPCVYYIFDKKRNNSMDKLIKRKVLISMLFIGLTMMGLFSYRYLPMELYPDAEYPTLHINVRAKTNLDPKYIENQAVIPVEGVVSGIEGVEEIKTRINPQGANTTVSFSKNTNIKYAYLKLEERIKSITKNLPDEFTVQVNKAGTGMASDQFMTLQVLSSEDIDYVRNITDTDIVPILESTDGIASVNVIGGRQKSIEILLDKEKCKSLNITSSQISALIRNNMSEKTFAGSVYENAKRYFVNVTAEYLNTEDLGSIVVANGPILLKDIAEINFGIKEEETYSRVNGKEVITCIIAKSPLVNIIDLSERIRKEIKQLNTELTTKGVSIHVDTDEAEIMSKNIDIIIHLAITGAILAIFILYLFLKNFKIVTFIAFAIPISVFSAFYFFYFFDISINTLTLTGIALAVGMLLDNSVVVMENIFRLRAIGMPKEKAAVQGTKEVSKAVIAATLTTITVFLPFLFSDDFLLKLIGKHIGVSIITTLLLSLAVALLLIPMAVNQFMKKQSDQVNFSSLSIHSRPIQIYIALLKICLRKPSTIIFSALAVLAITLALSLTLTLNTLKEIEADTFNIYITFPNGNTLSRTDETVREYEKRLQEIPEIEQYNSQIFTTDARLTIKLKEDFEKIGNKTLNELKDLVINKTKGLRISDVSYEAIESSENFQGGGGSALMSGSEQLLRRMGMGRQSEKIIIKGQDFEKMSNLAELLEYQLEELENISNASMSYSRGMPEARILFDPYLMGIYDVTPSHVATELNNFAPQNTTSIKYKAGDEEYDIIIKDKELTYQEEESIEPIRTLEDLRNLEVINAKHSITDLRSFSQINLGRGQGSIIRINQDKEITVNYTFNSDVNESKSILEGARMEVDDLIQRTDIPTGIAVEIVHEEDETGEFTFLILAAFAIIYMILASVFESVTSPVVLMFAIPLAAIGSLLALLFTSNSLMNANVLIGVIILIGIVVNNSIILIDYTSQLRRQGNRKPRALIIAGISRVRPILITAITTIVAMFPLAMGQGEFVSGLGAPFAITVIGGLTMSTLLTLVIIPTLYSGMEDALYRLRTQNPLMKLLQIFLLIVSVTGIYLLNATIMWKIAYLISAIILIPAATWFIETSLRQANSRIIPPDQDIHISIRNLVKIYGRPNEFQREWTSGQHTRERLGLKEEYRTLKDLQPLIWIIPLTGFTFYFTYSYQTIAFWALIFAICTWMLTVKVIRTICEYLKNNGQNLLGNLFDILNITIYYLSPLATLVWATLKFSDSGVAILLGLIWYIAIAAHYLSERIHKHNIEIDQIEGRFCKIKKIIYQIATQVPVIGYKKKPFKALNAVSMDIHTGMFGLLGPNGAGKTTLMRIICGIFEQSYGKIFINGIDTQKKREELQGLIGYLPQEFGTYENLTSWEFLEYQALLKGIYNPRIRKQRITEVLEAVHMYENKDKKIGGFSGGMKQRIGIAQTLLNLPRILVVDEPTAGLDPRERIRFRNLLVELSRNRIVIFSTHIIEDIASSCNQVGVINKGSLKYHGTPTDMVEIAKNVTWTFEIPARDFAKLPSDLLLVHHIRNGENIKVRCLSETQPVPHAVRTTPLLEDSYLWLLRNVKLANHEQIITQ